MTLDRAVERVPATDRLGCSALGEQALHRELDQPFRLMGVRQQAGQVRVVHGVGDRVEDAPQEAEEPGCEHRARLVLREPRQPGARGVADVHRSGTHPGDPCDRNPDGARCRGLPGFGVAPAQLLGQCACPPLTLVEHPEADVDLGDPPGHPVVDDGDAFGQPAYVVEAQRGLQEGQSDRGTFVGKPRWCAGNRDAHDGVCERGPAVHWSLSPRAQALPCSRRPWVTSPAIGHMVSPPDDRVEEIGQAVLTNLTPRQPLLPRVLQFWSTAEGVCGG
jgi:hypothetical protein